MPKRQNQNSGDEPTRSVKKSRMVPGNTSTTENPLPPCGLKNSLHGNVFQLKLLMLFLIRGIVAGYQFELGTEIPGMGGKFDDLIFKFKKAKNINEASSTEEQIERYRFLQAKHKQNEETGKITATDLRNNSGDFSLPKYFRSYCREIKKHCSAENVRDCIICTNIGFGDEEAITKLGKDGLFQLLSCYPRNDPDKILVFDPIRNKESGITIKTPARYKLKNTDKLRQEMKKWSEVHLLATTLLKYVSVKDPKLDLNCDVFKNHHLVLVKEWEVIERQKKNKEFSGKLGGKFMDGKNLTGSVNEFRKILSDLTFEQEKNKKKTDSPESIFQEFWSKKSFKLSASFGDNKSNKKPSDETKESLDCAIHDEDITHFLDKLVFAVHTPNEVELETSLKEEVGKYYELHENDFQSDFILRNMLDWFKKKESTFMTSEEGTKIFKKGKKKMKSLRVTGISIDYQKQLKKVLKFNEEAIGEMKSHLISKK